MTSLMSIFDPSMGLPQLGWFTFVAVLPLLKFSFWNGLSSFLSVFEKLLLYLLQFFNFQKLIFVTLFIYIFVNNLLGLLPMVFSPTSHLSFNISMSLSLWLGMMLWYAWMSTGNLLTHLTPVGSPLGLAPVLVLIELISLLIRPLSLALRLMANIMAGHMILVLLSLAVLSLNLLVSLPLFVVAVLLLLFESGVALIQAYVFSMLMSLYWEESEESSH